MSVRQTDRPKNDEFPRFLDDEKQLPAELLDKDAQDWANKFSYKISTHQIRRFFDEVKRYKQQLENTRVEFTKLKPLIFMLKSKATYAAHKKPEMKAFADFIEKSRHNGDAHKNITFHICQAMLNKKHATPSPNRCARCAAACYR